MSKAKSIILATISVTLMAACTQPKQYYEESGTVFHTIYHVKYEASKLLTDSIDAELRAFNLSLNPFNPKSIIARVNNNEPVDVDDWFTEVFNKSMDVSRRSDGMFDITCAPLVNLWGFGFSHKDSISSDAIDSMKEFVGYEKVNIVGKRVVKKDSRLMLNCSAIAKGFASDVIARLLERNEVENYMVEIGGEVTMKGINEKGECWRIGINLPEDDTTGMDNEICQIVSLCKKGGIATSGNYRNFYIKDGKKFAHTINPKTGYPAESDILSATIVAPDCMTADAYATTFMVVGRAKAKEIAKTVPGIDYYIIYSDSTGKQKSEYSKGMVNFLVRTK